MHALRIIVIILCFGVPFKLLAAEVELLAVRCICSYGSQGTIEIGLTHTEQAFTFEWNGPNYYRSTAQNPRDLVFPGDYYLTYTNEIGCSVEFGPVHVPRCTGVDRIEFELTPDCLNQRYAVHAVVYGGEAPLTYEWSNGAEGSATLEDLPAGDYQLTVTDAQGCSFSTIVELEDLEQATNTHELEAAVDCLCGDEDIAAFDLSINSDHTAYTYNWSGPGGYEASGVSPLARESGLYVVTITDGLGCDKVLAVDIPNCSEGLQAVIRTTPSCPDAATGQATVSAEGPYPPFRYRWSTGDYTRTVTGIPAGVYTVTVTDNKDCTIVERVSVGSAGLPVQLAETPVDCGGEGSGQIIPLVTGGSPPYHYAWSTGSDDNVLDRLRAGTYELTVSDDYGCTGTLEFEVLARAFPEVDVIVQSATCASSTGRIKLLPSMDASFYTYEWADQTGSLGTTSVRDNLPAGRYSVTITERGRIGSNNCPLELNVEVPAVERDWGNIVLSASLASSPASCDGRVLVSLPQGEAYHLAIVGTDGLIAERANVTGTAEFSGICGSDTPYNVRVTDQSGCSWEGTQVVGYCDLSIEVQAIRQPQAQPSNSILIAGQDLYLANGSIRLDARGGNGALKYTWNTGAVGSQLEGLSRGTYVVTVTDEAGCSSSRIFDLDGCYHLITEEVEIEGGVYPRIVERVPLYEDFDIMILGGIIAAQEEEIELEAVIRYNGENNFHSLDLSEDQRDDLAIQWMNGGHTAFETAYYTINKEQARGNRSVTLTVSNGCLSRTVTKEILICGDDYGGSQVLRDRFVWNENRPCTSAGMEVGSLQLLVDAFAAGQPPRVYLNGEEQQPNLTIGPGVVFALEAAVGDHELRVDYGEGCAFVFPYTMESEEEETTFSHLDVDAEQCVYERSCGPIPMGETRREAIRHYRNARTCKIPLRCALDGPDLAEKRLKKWRLRGIQFLDFLTSLQSNPSNPYAAEEVAMAFADLMSNANRVCNWYRVCPANLAFSHLGMLNAGQMHIQTTTVGGCTQVQCFSLIGDGISTSCGPFIGGLISSLGNGIDGRPLEVVQSCPSVVTHNLYDLQDYFDANPNDIPGEYVGSSLQEFILEYGRDERAPCASVTYCADDFTFYYSNIDQVICGRLPSQFLSLGVVDANGDPVLNSCEIYEEWEIVNNRPSGLQEVSYCYGSLFTCPNSDCSEIVHRYVHNRLPGIRPLVGEEGGEVENSSDHLKVITRADFDEEFDRFAFAQYEDTFVPKGLVQSNGGQTKIFYDFGHHSTYVHKLSEEVELVQQIENWTTWQDIYLYRDDDQLLRLIYQDTLLGWWEKTLYSEAPLEVSEMYFEDDIITLVGYASGSVFFDQAVLFSSENPTLFSCSISIDGEVLFSNVVENIEKDKAMLAKHDEGVAVLAQSSVLPIIHQGRLLSEQATPGDWVSISLPLGTTSAPTRILAQLPTQPGIELVTSAVSPSGQSQSYLLRKTSTSQEERYALQLSNAMGGWRHPTTVNIAADYYFVSLKHSDGTYHAWPIDIENGDITNPKIVYDDKENLLISMNFTGGMQTPAGPLQSAGGSDIVVAKLRNTGGLAWIKHYGSVDHEEVVDVVVANGGVYLGGQFSGKTRERTIGDFTFVTERIDESSKAFVTFIDDGVIETQRMTEDIDASTQHREVKTIRLYPNPFEDNFTIDIPAAAADEAQLRIYDLNGRLILERRLVLTSGLNSQTINLTEFQIPKGTLLTVRIDLASGQYEPYLSRVLHY